MARGACGPSFAELVETNPSRLSAPPALQRKLATLFKIARKRGYDELPLVHYMDKLIENASIRKQFRYSQDMWVHGEVVSSNGVLMLSIDSVNLEAKWFNKLGVTVPGRAPGAATAFSKLVYAVFNGIERRIASDPSLNKIVITGDEIINNSLKQMFTELGFVSSQTGKPLTQAEIDGAGQTLELVLHVKR